MFGYSPLSAIARNFLTLVIIALSSAALCHSATVYIHPGDDIPSVVAAKPAGTKFIIYPGLYRLTQSIIPKTGDSFIGQTACKAAIDFLPGNYQRLVCNRSVGYVRRNELQGDEPDSAESNRRPGGYMQSDPVNQPNFFANNKTPDYNNYHMPTLASNFLYDNNNTAKNVRKSFAEYQAAGADPHGSADTNYNSGFPTVALTSPADQSSFTSSLTVDATASDKSGINRVELYIDWKLQSTIAGPPYDFSLTNLSTLTTGAHTVAAMAYSNAGIRNCYAVTLNKN